METNVENETQTLNQQIAEKSREVGSERGTALFFTATSMFALVLVVIMLRVSDFNEGFGLTLLCMGVFIVQACFAVSAMMRHRELLTELHIAARLQQQGT